MSTDMKTTRNKQGTGKKGFTARLTKWMDGQTSKGPMDDKTDIGHKDMDHL